MTGIIKVTFSGETKRVSAPTSYAQLLSETQKSFTLSVGSWPSNKFYLLDEDQELISISSQDDFSDNSEYFEVSDGSKQTPALIYSSSSLEAANQLKEVMNRTGQSSFGLGESAVSSQSHMMQAIQRSMKQKLESKLGSGSRSQPSLESEESLNKMIGEAVKKEVEVYCTAHLPRMIREQLALMGIQPKLQEAQQPSDMEEEKVPAASNPCKSGKDQRYSSSFVRENKLEETIPKEYPAGSIFKRSFTLNNDGDSSWPKGTNLRLKTVVDGFEYDAVRVANNEEVAAGQDYTFVVTCHAPEQEGLCSVQFSLHTAEGCWFGAQVQCSFYVPKLEQDKLAMESLLLVNRDKSASDKSVGSPSPKVPAAESQLLANSVSIPNPYVDMIPQQQSQLVSPKQIYTARYQKDSLNDHNLIDGLNRLFEMGFTDYDVNLALMLKYGYFGAAAEHLCAHGGIAESI